MARNGDFQLVDDLDHTDSDDISTVQFGLDGVVYEIDLTEANAARLRDICAEYVASGRRTDWGCHLLLSTEASRVGHVAGNIREWARANHIHLPPRGNIPAYVIDSFRESLTRDQR